MLFPFAASKRPRGWKQQQETRLGARDTQGEEMPPRAACCPSCPSLVTSSGLVVPREEREGSAKGQ